MKRFLFDSGSATHYMYRHATLYPRAVLHRKAGHTLGTCIPVIGELWAGVENSQVRDASAKVLRQELRKLSQWPYTTRAAEEFGRISAELRRKGITIQQIDRQIAAIALTLGNCTVVTRDSDFRHVVGLKVEDWSV